MTVERKLYELNRFDNDVTATYWEPQQVAGAAEPVGAWLSMLHYDRAMFIVLGGNWTNIGDTLDLAVWQATSNAGAGAVALGKAIATYTSLATNEDNLWLIHVNVAELDVDNGYAYIQLRATVSAGDSVYLGAVCQRQTRVFEPVPVINVTEIVA